jgi:hypothetical protein
MDAIKNWVITRIVTAAVTRLATMFNPVGAVIQAILAIYNTIMFFIERINQILAVVESVVESIANIAAGSIVAAANYVEQTMARTLPVIISFLARLIGLGNISSAIRGIIQRIRRPIDQAIDRVVNWIGRQARRLIARGRAAVAGVVAWWRARKRFQTGAESHSLYFQGSARSARLMISSAPQPLEGFVQAIKNRPENNTPQKRAAIATIEEQIRLLEQLATSSDSTAPGSSQVDPEQALNTIAQLLPELVGAGQVGTPENPIPMDWPKYASANYAPIYLGPRSANRIPQTVMRDAFNKQGQKTTEAERQQDGDFQRIHNASRVRYEDINIDKFEPHQHKSLPGGGPTIGVTSEYQIRTGMALKMENPGSTQGGGVINSAIRPYGFSPMGERKAGDHILEMQLGGPNIKENLWPLSFGVNSSGGSLISRMQFTVNGVPKRMAELKAEAQSRPIWFTIQNVRSGSDSVGPS